MTKKEFDSQFNKIFDKYQKSYINSLKDPYNYCESVVWIQITNNIELTDDFLKYKESELNWGIVSKRYKELTDKQINKYFYRLNWSTILTNHKLDEKILSKIIKLNNKYTIDELISTQNLSESFIEKYKFELNWNLIFEKQHLDPEFRAKHEPTLAIYNLFNYNGEFKKAYMFYELIKNT